MTRLHRLLLACVALAGPAWAQAPGRPSTPLVFAHRGASQERPEHTLGAYRLALEQGADFIEPDLRMTRDGNFIALHDSTLNRTTDVAGKSEFAAQARVDTNGVARWYPEDFTLAELKTLRAKQGTGGRSPAFDGQEPIPTLLEVVELVRAFNRERGRRVGLVPELRGHAEAFVQFVREHQLEGPEGLPLYLQSFELATLQQVRPRLAAPCAWLVTDWPDRARWTELKGSLQALALAKPAVLRADARARIAEAKAAGFAVIAWTFADDRYDRKQFASADEELRQALRNGVDAFFTDTPAGGVRVRDAMQAGGR